MPTVKKLLENLGCDSQGAEFFLPEAYPHVHIRVSNAEKNVQDIRAVRPEIVFISLSWGDTVNTVNLYRRDSHFWFRGAKVENLESRVYNIAKKERFEVALHQSVGIAVAMDMQRMLNLVTGMGIDL